MLEIFKRNSLKCLESKKEKENFYPIRKSDLVYVKNCSFCEFSDTELVAQVYLKNLIFFETSICKNCLFTFRSISPSFAWFKKCWDKIAITKLEVFSPATERIRESRYKECYQKISKYARSGTLLDVGAAYGTGADFFRKKGYIIEAVEPEFNKANYIKNFFKIPVVAGDIVKFSSRKYDVIIFSHCLEHLDRPQLAIKSLRELLNPDGIIYLEIPIIWGFVTWSDALFLTHKSNFTRENIMEFLTRNGFEVLETIKLAKRRDYPDLFGCVLRLARVENRDKVKQDFLYPKQNKSRIIGILKLYRKNLPLKVIPPINEVLKYRVPYINHFFQTLKLTNFEMMKPDDSEFISFRPK